jgi:iron(III) transport system ATP-binding protein
MHGRTSRPWHLHQSAARRYCHARRPGVRFLSCDGLRYAGRAMAVPITTTGLTKHFGKVVAVDRLDLEVPAGSLFFLLGPSGCGKTTLLRMLAGFTDPTAGTIRLGDRDVTHVSANKRDCGMVFQSYALWPHMTVAQNVAFGLTVRKVSANERSRRVAAALGQVQMDTYAQRKPNELSGGQQQRVALARALVIEPTVLLLDEPLSNLDAKLRLDMRSQIKRICKQAKITAVYVTHDQQEALSMADVMAVLRDGAVHQVGPPRQVYARPCNRFVADFLGETNFIPAQVMGRDDDTLILDTPIGQLRSATYPDELASAASTASGRAKVLCSIRPEAVRLLPDGATHAPAGANCLEARHLETVFLGELSRHHLVLGQDVSFKASEMNVGARAVPNGGKMTITFDTQDVVVLAD